MAELFFRGNPALETERLILRRLMPEDASDIYEYGSDDEVTRYMTWPTQKCIEDASWFIDFTLERYKNNEAGEWGIVLKEKAKLIGCIGIPRHDMNDRRAEIGYVLSRAFWGKGYMTETLKRIIKFAFEEMGLNRVECCHFLPNEKSGRVMQRAGMSFEGIARQKIFAKDSYWDTKQYAILREDWISKL